MEDIVFSFLEGLALLRVTRAERNNILSLSEDISMVQFLFVKFTDTAEDLRAQ
jgi:hypothetical protein